MIPAPSDMTNPSLSRSNGLLAERGLSFLLDNAFMLLNALTQREDIVASVPPAIITSAFPFWMTWKASAMACAPDAHAVMTEKFAARIPNLMAI